MLGISERRIIFKQAFRRRFDFPRNLNRYRTLSTLAFLETDQSGQVTTSSLQLIQAAQGIGNSIIGLLIGSNAKGAATTLANSKIRPNLDKVIVIDDQLYNTYLPEPTSKLITSILKEPENKISHFLMSSNNIGQNILPRVSAYLNAQPITNVIEIKNSNTFVRTVKAGSLSTTISSQQVINLLTIRTAMFQKPVQNKTDPIDVEIKKYAIELRPEENACLESEESVSSQGQNASDLSSAKIVIAGGNGLKDKVNFEKLIYPLASKLKAGVGATRAAVDSGFCNNSLQIGQTGKTIAPNIYIGVGISGAVQHLAGMRESSTIIAVNTDRDAPLCKLADYSLHGDLFKILPELTEKLE